MKKNILRNIFSVALGLATFATAEAALAYTYVPNTYNAAGDTCSTTTKDDCMAWGKYNGYGDLTVALGASTDKLPATLDFGGMKLGVLTIQTNAAMAPGTQSVLTLTNIAAIGSIVVRSTIPNIAGSGIVVRIPASTLPALEFRPTADELGSSVIIQTYGTASGK